MSWPYDGAEGISPEQEQELLDVEHEEKIAWCRMRDIDPFEIVADGGVEAWMAVTEHQLERDACPVCNGDCGAANPPVTNCPGLGESK
jgi:hypothetical protein